MLLPPLKAIWLAALPPCGERLKACLPDWLPAYEADHHPLDANVRQALLAASRATLDRLLIPVRVAHRRRATTRPGSLLRGEIPIRTEWPENAPGFLERCKSKSPTCRLPRMLFRILLSINYLT